MKCAAIAGALLAVYGSSSFADESLILRPDEAVTLFKTPTRITAKGQDAPVVEIFESIMKQAKQPYNIQGNGRSDKMTIDITAQPFWDAAIAFERASTWQFNMTSSGHGDEPRYTLSRAMRSGGLKSESGPLTGYLQSVIRTKTSTQSVVFSEVISTIRNEDKVGEVDQIKIPVGIYLDPAVPIVSGSVEVGPIEAFDENNQPLTIGGGLRGGAWKVQANLTAAPQEGMGKKIANLKVHYRAIVAMQPQLMVFDDVNDEAQTKSGDHGEKYEVAEAKAVPTGYSVTLKALRSLDGLEFRSADAVFGQVQITDATGKVWKGRLSYSSGGSRSANPNALRQMEARVGFGRPGDSLPGPLKLTWTVPTSFRSFETILEWKDVPLP